jgi:hypothetical protein
VADENVESAEALVCLLEYSLDIVRLGNVRHFSGGQRTGRTYAFQGID